VVTPPDGPQIRKPDGTLRQLSSTGGTAKLEAISDAGDVIFTTMTNVGAASSRSAS
jgi:hypothetical protein